MKKDRADVTADELDGFRKLADAYAHDGIRSRGRDPQR
jgi:hypothetical protein